MDANKTILPKIQRLQEIFVILAEEHAEIHPEKGDAPTFNEGGIGYEGGNIVREIMTELSK